MLAVARIQAEGHSGNAERKGDIGVGRALAHTHLAAHRASVRWIVAAAAAVLVLCGVGLYLNNRRKAEKKN
jgi:hypothetical protein